MPRTPGPRSCGGAVAELEDRSPFDHDGPEQRAGQVLAAARDIGSIELEHGLTSIRLRAHREQAELHAAGGRFQAAYEEHKLYCAELVELQSAQRDARARALHAMYETTEARQQSRRHRELSLRDPLTGLYNRRYVDEESRLLTAHPGEVTVALLDLDHFKRINDTCSHEAGVRVLRTVAELLQETGGSSAGSFVARLGGEEFLLVLTGADPVTAGRQLDEVRRAIAEHPWGELTRGLPVTVSIGVAGADRLRGATPAQVLGRADARLYAAKRQGRDRVVTSG